MALSLWKPVINRKHVEFNTWGHLFRKVYVDGYKQDIGLSLPYEIEVVKTWEEITLKGLYGVIKRCRSANKDYALAMSLPKAKGLLTRDEEHIDASLNIDWVLLDIDNDYEGITKESSLRHRVEVLEERLPFLKGLERVVSFSNSAYFDDKQNPNRANLWVFIKLDKKYSREKRLAFLKTYKEYFDTKVLNPTQPLFISNPLFIRTDKVEYEETIFHEEGLSLNIDDLIDYKKISQNSRAAPRTKGALDHISLTEYWKDREDYYLKKFPTHADGLGRNEFWMEEIRRSFNIVGGYPYELLEICNRNPRIIGNQPIESMVNNWNSRLERSFNLRGEREIERFKECFNAVKKIEIIDCAEIDIKELELKNSILAIKSGCGTGKTKLIKRVLDANPQYKRILYISVLRSTIKPVCIYLKESGYDFSYYEDYSSTLQLKDRLGITNKSLKKLFADDVYKPFDLVIMDEAEHIALDACRKELDQSYLYELTTTADSVLMLDADITQDLIGWFAKEIADYSGKLSTLYVNYKDHLEHKRIRLLDTEKDAIRKIDESLSKGETVYCHVGYGDGYKKISGLVEYFKTRYPRYGIRGYDAESAPKNLRNEPDRTIRTWMKEEQLKLLIVSPFTLIGWSYLDKDFIFDISVGIYPRNIITAPDILQAMQRPRLTLDHYIYTQASKIYFCDSHFGDVQDFAIEGYSMMKKNISAQLQDKAIEIRARMRGLIKAHLGMLAGSRGARVFNNVSIDYIDPEREKELDKLLHDYIEDEVRKGIEDSFNDKLKRLRIIRNYKNEHGYLDLDESMSLNEFIELYKRNESLNVEMIERISTIRAMSKEERELYGTENNYIAVNQGETLESIDRLIMSTYPNGHDRFLSWIIDDTSMQFDIVIHNADDLKKCLQRVYMTQDDIWIERYHLQRPYTFLKEFLEKFDLRVDVDDPPSKKEAKEAIRKYYWDNTLELKDIKRYDKEIAKQIEIINGVIANKNISDYNEEEIDWIASNGRKLITVIKRDFVNERIKEAIKLGEWNIRYLISK